MINAERRMPDAGCHARGAGRFLRAVAPGCVAAFALAFSAAAAEPWHVKEAPIRFKVQLKSGPTHASAGYFVHLPDGGILPRQYSVTTVTAANGAALKSFLFWPNAKTGAGVLFEEPSPRQDVFVYIVPNKQPAAWTAASGLTPSALLCTASGRGSKQDAQELGRLGPVGTTVHYQNRAGCPPAPVSVPGDLSGRMGPAAIYMLAHLSVTDPGKTWIAPIEFSGRSEVLIDGKPIVPEKRNAKAGGTGAWMELSQGIHRLEIFSWTTDPAGPQGMMSFTWNTPHTSPKELGGIRPSDLRYPGTPMWESRRLHAQEIVRSGEAEVARADAGDGRPLARIRMSVLENFWMENEKPLVEYELSPDESGNPQDTRYEWSFGNGAELAKPLVRWLFTGEQEQQVTLTASSGGKQTSCTVPFYPFTTKGTSMNDLACRENFQRAALDMFEAYPAGKDPTATWTASHWSNLFRTLELNRGRDLLLHIFRARWDVVSKKLSPERRQIMLDIFLDFLPRINPSMAVTQIEALEKQIHDAHDLGMLKILRAEICMYYLDDRETARKILASAAPAGSTDDISEWARIRMGDIFFMEGNLDEATRLYGEVQNRAKKSMHAAGAQGQTPAQRLGGGGLATSKAELKAQRDASDAARAPSGGHGPGRAPTAAEWKVNALLDASYAETVKSLIAQNFLLEAKQGLREWERQFPLSKISGDFVLQEARFYMAVEDWRRAHDMLNAYCDQVDASSFLPPAAKALLDCKLRMNLPDAELIKFCEKMKKKLEFHPVGREMATLLRSLQSSSKR